MKREVIGAVLAGGRGRRMGRDKALLEIGGRTLVRRAVDVLRSVGLDIVLVLRSDQLVPEEAGSIAIVRDEVEDAGPLAGLHALLRQVPAEWALVAPCDQPFLAPELLRGLLAEPRNGVQAVVGRPARRIEPLPGLYRCACLPVIEEALARPGRERSLQGLLFLLRVRAVSGKTLRRWDPSLRSYLNVNTSSDLARARALAVPAVPEGDEADYP